MRILQVCAEIFPLLKTGGLADVAGALPPALGALGADVRVLLPGFDTILAHKPVTTAADRVARAITEGDATDRIARAIAEADDNSRPGCVYVKLAEAAMAAGGAK